jgi:membrane associated rhomboid family serine protease
MERNEEQGQLPEDDWQAIRPEQVDRNLPVRLTERRVRLWALVLDSRSVPCCIEHEGNGWQLLVPAEHLDTARNELRTYERKNRNWPPSILPSSPLVDNTLVTLSVLLLLATFHNVTRLGIPLFGATAPDWGGLGSASAGLILDGQWWRTVTALTLHADWLHLLSNLAIGGVFIVFLCRELGSGLSWSLLLASGILGNLANACLQRPSHNAVGASTAVFGAVGILAALNMVRHRRLQRRWLLPVAAALALLAILGTEGKNTDLGAHLFGFVFGGLLGLGAELLVGRYGRPGWLLNFLLAVLSALVVLGAWWAALTVGSAAT